MDSPISKNNTYPYGRRLGRKSITLNKTMLFFKFMFCVLVWNCILKNYGIVKKIFITMDNLKANIKHGARVSGYF